MKLTFDTHGNDRQKEACIAWADPSITDIVFGGGKGGGKTYLGCGLIGGDALMYPETFYFIARKSLNDLRKFTVPSFHEAMKTLGVRPAHYKYNAQDNYFEMYNRSKVFLIDARYMPSDPLYMRFGSMQMTRGMIEEAGEFSLEAKNNLQAAIGRWKNQEYDLSPKLLQTCNPAKNYLYSDYYKKNKAGTLEPWKRFIPSLLDDNKMLSEQYKQNLLRSLTTNQIERLVYGNWEYDDDPTILMEYDAICDIFTNTHIKESGTKYVSGDLAMMGRDRFVAGTGCGDASGMVCEVCIDKPKASGRSIEEDMGGLIKSSGVGRSRAVVDSDGLGSYLSSYLVGIKEFHGGAAATDGKYYNLRSECYYKLAEMVNKRLIYVKCTEEQAEEIKKELEVVKAEDVDNLDKKKKVIPKEKMKELIGKSPDYADFLMMLMSFIVKPPSRGIRETGYKHIWKS